MKRFTGFFDILKGAFRARFQPATLSADRTITLPDKTGTLAVMETSGSTATSIKLDGFTSYPSLTVTGAISFTAAAGAVAGGEATVRLVANGSNVPTFGSFKKRSDSRAYVNTNGTVNVILFNFDGVDYWYRVWQESATPVTADDLVALTGNQMIDGIKTFNNAAFVCGGATSAPLANQSWTGSSHYGLQVTGNQATNSPAFLAFHRPGISGRYFGLDTDGSLAAVGGNGGGSSPFKCGTLTINGTSSGTSSLILTNESKTGTTARRSFFLFNTKTGEAGYPPVGGLHFYGYSENNVSIIAPFSILDTGQVVINDNSLRIPPSAAPLSNATGVAGDIRFATDGNVYICVGANSWRRIVTTTY